ncbi:isochorismatase family protein [Labilibacter sediminis]|nr:isochorismatase family protein [Labilibacter sediminis]
MVHLKDNNTALLIIDVQKGFEDEAYWGSNKNAEEICAKILTKWRDLKLHVFHIIHSSQNPKSKLHKSHPGFKIHDLIKPLENKPLIIKNVNSEFIGTNLKERLDKQKITQIIIIGLTTNHCISASARMAENLGYDTFVISDATATFDRISINEEQFSSETIHQTALASLNEEFAKVINSKQLFKIV